MWLKLTFLTVIIGFILDLFGFAIGINTSYCEIVGLLIAGFLCYLLATFLVLPLVFLDEAKGNKWVIVSFIVFALLAGRSVHAEMRLYAVLELPGWGGMEVGGGGGEPPS